jgi:hypothetical protein
VWVADTADPVLLRMVGPPSGGGSFNFSDYGAAVTVTTPSGGQILDGKKYGL